MVKSHLNLRIFGQVQGVFFRYYAQLKAKELGITGFVRNEAGGAVYLEAEGEKEALKKFVRWCHQGPSGAVVEKVAVSEYGIKNYQDFVIER